MPVSLWLRPEAPVAEALDAAIRAYALPRGRTPFPAHLTLASGNALSDRDFKHLTASAGSISLEPDGLLETPAFFQVFALRFRQSPKLMGLREKAYGLLGTQADADYTPHLSLTYGLPIERDVLLELARRFNQPVRFDRLVAVRYDASEPSQAAVAAWKLSAPIPLGA